jgi:hypothetical protein
MGLERALDELPGLARGIAVRDGEIVHQALAAAFYAGADNEHPADNERPMGV